jgi:hypothetical protein
MPGGYGYRERKDPPRPTTDARVTQPPRLEERRTKTGATRAKNVITADEQVPADLTRYGSGESAEELKPAQAGADVTGHNTAADVQTGEWKAVREAGADRTANNTAADAANLNGVSAATVQGEGQEGYRRVGTLYDADGVLGGTVLQRDGLGDIHQVLTRGLRFGYAADGDAVAFDPPFQDAPLILLFNVGGRSYDGTLAAQQYLSLTPESPSVSGFTVRGRIREAVGGTTPGSASFAGDPPTATKMGATEAWDDRYTVDYSLDVPAGEMATVTLYTRPSSAAAWTQRDARSYRGEGTFSDSRTITVDGLGAGAEFQLVLTSTALASGAVLTAGQVAWEEAAEPTDSSMTPNGEAGILWVALAGV